MTTTENRTELILRFSRLNMIVVLLLILTLGLFSLAATIQPRGAIARLADSAPWLIPIAIVVVSAALQTSQRRKGVAFSSPEAQSVLKDEWRQTNLDRARWIALLVTLAAQVPIALLLAQSPGGLGLSQNLTSFRTAMAMAVATITLGASVFIVSFLVLDRE